MSVFLFSSSANKVTEKKLSELQGVREKVEFDLQEKLRNLEKDLENSNTRLADFKRRGIVLKMSVLGVSAFVLMKYCLEMHQIVKVNHIIVQPSMSMLCIS